MRDRYSLKRLPYFSQLALRASPTEQSAWILQNTVRGTDIPHDPAWNRMLNGTFSRGCRLVKRLCLRIEPAIWVLIRVRSVVPVCRRRPFAALRSSVSTYQGAWL